jgi:hypothetical protein
MGNGQSIAKGCGVSVLGSQNVLKLIVLIFVQLYACTKNH